MRLLLAEDEKSLSRALVKILEHGNYSVDAVSDGQAALEYLDAEDGRPDCFEENPGEGKPDPGSPAYSQVRGGG